MTAVIDSHAHAWARWPYQPAVPDGATRGRIEQLLWEMDLNDVAAAVIVSARIDDNDDNNVYVANAVAAHPSRLHQFADVDSYWTPEYHTPGAAARLGRAAARWPIAGITHYLQPVNDGWLRSVDGREFFAAAESLQLPVSLAAKPSWQRDIRELADALPRLRILVHHLGSARPWAGGPNGLTEVLTSARCPNISIKLSGFYYESQTPWEYPYPAALEVIRSLYDAYGGRRLCWGSDYPVVRRSMTYRQTLEVIRTHCTFISSDEMELVLGDNMRTLLSSS